MRCWLAIGGVIGAGNVSLGAGGVLSATDFQRGEQGLEVEEMRFWQTPLARWRLITDVGKMVGK